MAGCGLTIRSSRVRFAASTAASYDWTTAAAALLPGLAQALDLAKHDRNRSHRKTVAKYAAWF